MLVGGMPPGQPVPRPFLLGLILVLLVLSMQSDWSQPAPGRVSSSAMRAAPRTGELKQGVPETIIYELSLDNERLEGEVAKLKEYVLALRRAARKAGCPLLDDSILTLYPELHPGGSSGIGNGTQQQQPEEEGQTGEERGSSAMELLREGGPGSGEGAGSPSRNSDGSSSSSSSRSGSSGTTERSTADRVAVEEMQGVRSQLGSDAGMGDGGAGHRGLLAQGVGLAGGSVHSAQKQQQLQQAER